MESITIESKLRGMYARTTPSAFLYWVKRVVKMKKRVNALNVEVQNRLLMYDLMNRFVPDAGEHAAAKIARTKEFWNAYRDPHRYAHVPVRTEPGAPVWAGWGATCGGMGSKASREKPLLPASHSSQSVRHGMVWNSVTRELQWEIVNPAPGSLLAERHGAQSPARRPLRRPSSVASFESRGRNNLQDVDAFASVRAGRHRYLRECEKRIAVPMPLRFTTGHSVQLEAVGRNLIDGELEAVAGAMTQLAAVEMVDLTGNKRLTDKGVVPVLKVLVSPSLRNTLRSLNLSGLAELNTPSIEAVIKVLSCAECLQHLDLSNVPLPIRCQLPLCDSIGAHSSLSCVNLANTGLGSTNFTEDWCARILKSTTLEKLDVSWNSFTQSIFLQLGLCLTKNQKLKALSVANCSGTHDVGDKDPPVAFFVETLAYDSSLTTLDISLNGIDFRTALVIEDSLDTHKHLTKMDLSGNPLGVGGMRSMLRLLTRNHTGLMHFSSAGCFRGVSGDQESKAGQTFNYTNPGGKYILDLSKPSQRSLLRMLYKTVERLRLSNDEVFRDFPKSAAYVHPGKDAIGVWSVQTTGILSFNFDASRFMEITARGVADDDFLSVLRQHYSMMRFTPGFKKVIPMFSIWKQLATYEDEQNVFLQALSKDFNLEDCHVEHMMRSVTSASTKIVEYLLPAFPEDEAGRWLVRMLVPSLSHFVGIQLRISGFLECNFKNPTGHYKLALDNPTEFAVAERLLLLDRWEAAVDRRLGRFDVSARGNGSHIRNEHFQSRPLHMRCASVAEWNVPEHGVFEFDYCSSARTSTEAQVLSDGLWEDLLIQMNNSPLPPSDKIKVLRSISHNFYITSMHMRQMIGFFRSSEDRSEAFIIFYLRIVDMYNAKVFRVRFINREEVISLQLRLGYATFFPFLQPENSAFELDLSFWDQRLCASMYVALSLKENPYNIRSPEYIREDGTVDKLALGIPRSWGQFEKMPKGGMFKGLYVCSPDNRKFEFRKQLANTYGFFDLSSLLEDSVLWWTGLAEPPEDMIEFLEFLINNFDSAKAAFRAIDGPDGNGVITLREFEEGMEEIDCHKFDGKDRAQRVAAVFRYLDPGGEGSVSLDEFLVLDQLWKELDLSMREFVQFLYFKYDDIQDAWDDLDADGGGELDLDEWLEAVDSIGYFGPAAIVFNLLDNTDDGSISIEEFKVLEKYAPAKKDKDLGSRSSSKTAP
eukprot:TRINITY_DN7758_c1_g1_i1.p1 TRINITY_DN7758_c1_g1~~TRINITY_DN7758_c1_g1_i1.p1  ORF type:complete len:1373 (-),score=176.40 TRINITY_DN7758_c1_g1_i1:329-3958(-)